MAKGDQADHKSSGYGTYLKPVLVVVAVLALWYAASDTIPMPSLRQAVIGSGPRYPSSPPCNLAVLLLSLPVFWELQRARRTFT